MMPPVPTIIGTSRLPRHVGYRNEGNHLVGIATRPRYIEIFRFLLELSFQLVADGNAVAPGATGGEDWRPTLASITRYCEG